METIFDLPAHPLMVHFPVVAIPVLALLGVVMAARPRFREQYAVPVMLLSVITVIATFMAANSGEALAESIGVSDEFIDPHRDLGNVLRFFVLGLTLAIGGMVAVNKRSSSTGRDPLAILAAVLVVGFSLLSLVWTVRTGHEGAKAVWGTDDTAPSDDAADNDEDTSDTAAASTTSAAPTTTEALSETSAPTETEPPTTTDEATTTEADPGVVDVDGQSVFEANCARCHGADGGGGRGPSLQGLAVEQPDNTEATQQVINGGRGMPAFGARLDPAQIDAAIAYIYETF